VLKCDVDLLIFLL